MLISNEGGTLDARIHAIGKLFHTSCRLTVPLYQRPYVWTQEKQWEPLWIDIRRLAEQLITEGSAKPHFLGAVVVDVDPQPIGFLACHVVVDGQQRLTTVQLFLEAMADNYERVCADGHEDVQVYARRARKLTRNQDLLEEDLDGEFKVWPMNVDRLSFKAVMQSGSPSNLRNDHAGNETVLGSQVARAYEFFYVAIEGWLRVQEDVELAVKKLSEVVENHLQVAVIDLQNSVDPQLIFETLNARGTPLRPTDLIKNFLFHQAALEQEDGVALYAEFWAPFDAQNAYWSETIGRGAMRRERLDTFMHHYLTMKVRDDVQVGRLYAEYRSFAEKTELSTVDQLEQIATYGAIYRSLDNLPAGSAEATFMYRLRQMDVATVMPFVLRLMGDATVSPDDRHAILADLESFLVRRLVCQVTTKAYNKIFVELLKATDEEGLSPDVVRNHMLGWDDDTTVWPDDEAFHTAWMDYRVYGWIAQARVRMIFEALEPMVRTDKSDDVMLIQQALTIEHLMPQSWQAHYPLPVGVDPEPASAARERVMHTFGNLTLLTQKLNTSVSNGAWERVDEEGVDKGKRDEILWHSNLGINSMLLHTKKWDEDAIRSRSEVLFTAARKLWPRPYASVPGDSES